MKMRWKAWITTLKRSHRSGARRTIRTRGWRQTTIWVLHRKSMCRDRTRPPSSCCATSRTGTRTNLARMLNARVRSPGRLHCRCPMANGLGGIDALGEPFPDTPDAPVDRVLECVDVRCESPDVKTFVFRD